MMSKEKYDQLPARRKCQIKGEPYYMVKDATGRYLRLLNEAQNETQPQRNALNREQWEALPARFRSSIGDRPALRLGKDKGREIIILFDLY